MIEHPLVVVNVVIAEMPPNACSGHFFNEVEQAELYRLAHSPNVSDKRRCVDYLDAATPQNRQLIFELADVLIPSRSSRVRWGTLINLGGFSETHPEELWSFVLKWGGHSSEDIRAGVACCILEHILGVDFAEYFARAKRAVQENRRFAFTLRMCFKFGQTEEPENAAAFDAFVSATKHKIRKKKIK